jgi:hypothetical protein
MDDSQITSPAQLDAALASQRLKKIESLERRTKLKFFWFALIPAAAIACYIYAYVTERRWTSIAGIGMMLLSMLAGYFQLRKQREDAANELAKELSR